MKMRRIFAAFLAVVMLLSVMPAMVTEVSAAEETPGGLFLDKTATLNNDGTYTIDLEAYATGTPVVSTVKEGVPLDIVLVVDHSGSMQTKGYLPSLKAAVNNFVKSVADNGKSFNVNHRIAITTFANNGDGAQSGTTADTAFTYVGQKDPNWGNTGLFKNDGTFENYGTATYQRITSNLSTSTKYYIKLRAEGGGDEMVQVRYENGNWKYYNGDSSTNIGSNNNLLRYEVYRKTGTTYNLDNEDYIAAWMDVYDGTGVNPVITNAISSFAANGPTYPAAAMEMAMKALENLPMSGEERNKLVVVFTDGQPGFSSFEEDEANHALEAASVIKNAGIEVYTIGLYNSANTNTTNFMNYLSSNYGPVTNMDRDIVSYARATTVNLPSFTSLLTQTRTTDYYAMDAGTYRQVSVTRNASWSGYSYEWFYTDADGNKQVICTDQTYDGNPRLFTRNATKGQKLDDKYYHTTGNMNQLNEIFQTITVDSTTTDTTIALGPDAILKDVMANGFKLTDQTVITVRTQTGRYNGNLDAFQITKDKITWLDTQTVATLNYSADNTSITQNGYTITVTESDVENHGASVDVTGFNYNEKYICKDHPGERLLVTITGIEADASVATAMEIYTNHGSSGVYEPADFDADFDGVLGEAQGSFESPTTYFNTATYVMDYAKAMTPSISDAKLTQVISADADGYHYFASANKSLDEDYGNVAIDEGEFTYTPETMKWDGYDTFFVFGTTNDAEIKAADANANGNVWSKITVIPANSVYYEDTFVQGENGVTVGIEYTGNWAPISAPGSNVENPENGESTSNDAQGGVHGWEDSLADDTGYSDGTAAVGSSGATATFTFTGTGVDIYSRTNMHTGLVMASIYAGEEAKGLALRTLMIDNFAHSGDYFMIPTLTLHEQVLRVNGETQYDENGNMLLVALPHGTYTVKLTVFATTDDADLDGVSTTRSTYYLDGIRVYNPVEVDSVVKEAYGDDELNAAFVEVRDILLDANSFSAGANGSAGAVFIDQMINKDEEGNVTEGAVPGSTVDIAVYEELGPKNEVYLGNKQMIAFAPGEGEKYYVGLKSPTGEPVTVAITGADGIMETFTVEHTTDLFYEIGSGDGIVSIMNNSNNLLSVTKIKATNPDPEMVTFAMFRSVSREEVLEAADAAYAALEAPEAPEVPDIDIEIENPEDQKPDKQPSVGGLIIGLVIRIIDDLWDWFH